MEEKRETPKQIITFQTAKELDKSREIENMNRYPEYNNKLALLIVNKLWETPREYSNMPGA